MSNSAQLVPLQQMFKELIQRRLWLVTWERQRWVEERPGDWDGFRERRVTVGVLPYPGEVRPEQRAHAERLGLLGLDDGRGAADSDLEGGTPGGTVHLELRGGRPENNMKLILEAGNV